MGHLTLTFLGTGTSLGVPIPGCHCEVCSSSNPKDKRLRCSAHIDTDSGVSINIDAGPDFREQMLRENIQRLDAILVTHEHRDHIGGLDDVRSYNYLQRCAMPVYANKEAIAGIKKSLYYVFDHFYPGLPEFELHCVDKDEPFQIKDVPVQPLEVMHAKLPTLAYRIGDLAYITDAKTINDCEIKKLYGVKTLVVNALREEEHFSHFNVTEALALVEKVKPQVTYFTHFSHDMGLFAKKEASLPENVHLAYDGLKIEAEY